MGGLPGRTVAGVRAVVLVFLCGSAAEAQVTCDDLENANQCCGTSVAWTAPDSCTGPPPTPTAAGNQCRADDQCYGSHALFTAPDTCETAGSQCRADDRCYGRRSSWTTPNSCDGTHVCGQLATCPSPTWQNSGMDRTARLVSQAGPREVDTQVDVECPSGYEGTASQLTCASGGL